MVCAGRLSALGAGVFGVREVVLGCVGCGEDVRVGCGLAGAWAVGGEGFGMGWFVVVSFGEVVGVGGGQSRRGVDRRSRCVGVSCGRAGSGQARRSRCGKKRKVLVRQGGHWI